MKEFLGTSSVPTTINDAERTVDVVWFTGIDVARTTWSGSRYIRRFDPVGVDLSLLNSGAPVFDNHNADGTESQKGVVERAWRDGLLYKATLRFSKRPAVDDIWRDIKDKIVQKFSMGVEILEEHELANPLFASPTNGDHSKFQWHRCRLTLAPPHFLGAQKPPSLLRKSKKSLPTAGTSQRCP